MSNPPCGAYFTHSPPICTEADLCIGAWGLQPPTNVKKARWGYTFSPRQSPCHSLSLSIPKTVMDNPLWLRRASRSLSPSLCMSSKQFLGVAGGCFVRSYFSKIFFRNCDVKNGGFFKILSSFEKPHFLNGFS